MKKHLRSKRYLRSRASIGISREKRRLKKLKKDVDWLVDFFDRFQRIDWEAVFEKVAREIGVLAQSASALIVQSVIQISETVEARQINEQHNPG